MRKPKPRTQKTFGVSMYEDTIAHLKEIALNYDRSISKTISLLVEAEWNDQNNEKASLNATGNGDLGSGPA